MRHKTPFAAALLIAALGCSLSALADTKIRVSSFEYNAAGLLTREVIEPNTPNDCLQTTYTYDGYGNKSGVSTAACAGATGHAIASAATARTASTTYASQSVTLNSLTYVSPAGLFANSSANALGHTESKLYDPRFGVVTSLTGPNGLITTWAYDGFGRKTQETRSDGTYTTWAYKLCTEVGANCPGLIPGPGVGVASVWVAIEQSYTAATATTVAAPEKRQFYDSLNRVVRVQTQGFDPVANTAGPVLVQDTDYNALGQTARKSNLYDRDAGTAQWTSYTYDALGRVTQETGPDGNTTVMAYNGLSTTVTNANGQTRTTTKNAQGQVALVTNAKGNTVTYSYDPLGNLLTTNAAGSVTSMSYNQRGQKVTMVDPAMGAWVYAYNVFGELVYQRDSLNQSSTMVYDLLGRMTQRTEPDLISDWSYETKFDGSSCGTGAFLGRGRLCEARSDNGYNRKHTYDAQGRILTTATVLDNVAAPATVSVAYEPLSGRVATKTWPTGYMATYAYTPTGFLKSVTGSGAGSTHSASYDVLAMNPQGQITQYRYGNNVTTVKTFESTTERLLGLTATLTGQGTGNVLNHSYTYDAVGNLKSRNDDTTGVGTQEGFSYDSLNRLTMASLTSTAVGSTFTEVMYDPRGNITYKSDTGRYWYDPARPNRITAVTRETAPGASIAFTGTRALSYAFDDLKAGAQMVNSTSMGNGNLEYTVSQDTTNGRHTVRWEAYTSYNMPQRIDYANFSVNTTSCLAGYALVGASCVKTVDTVNPATVSYTCPVNATLSGTNCVTANTTAPATVTYSCPSGQTLSGSTCVQTTTLTTTPGTSPASADRTLTFIYGPEHQRIRQTVALSGSGTSAYFAGSTWYLNGEDSLGLSYEKEIRANGTIENKHYVSAGGVVFALFTSRTGTLNGLPATTNSYFHHDQLGSIAAVTRETGVITERLAYDPWGKRRFIATVPGTPDTQDAIVGNMTDRGYTMHEHLDEIGVIHMNGRIYDPLIGRFMSADPFIQAAYNLQSYNRYSYVMNNPLAYTDPSGYFSLKKLFRFALSIAVGYFTGQWIGDAFKLGGFGAGGSGTAFATGGFELTTLGSTIAGAGGGFAAGAVATGSLNGALQGALTGGLFGAAGTAGASDSPLRYAAHAAAGCVSSAASGGQCGSGAASALFGKFATNNINIQNDVLRGVATTVAGGVGSVIAGGKFENGATTAAFGYLFNYLSNVHKALTMSAGRDAGLSEKDSLALSLTVKDADFVAGSQSPENAHWHSMCSAGDSSSVCATKTGDFLMQSWNSKSLTGFAQFLHAVQDSSATGHQGKVWEGGIPNRQHIEGDVYPAGDKARQIIEQSSKLIRSYKSFCPQCFPTTK